MVLIPAEMYQQEGGGKKNNASTEPQWNFETTQKYSTYPSSALDSDMSAILRDKNLSADVKYAQYQDAIQRHRIASFRGQQFPPQQLQQRQQQQQQQQQQQPSYKRERTAFDKVEMNIEELLRNIPDNKKTSARQLLNFLASLRQFSVNGRHEIQLNDETIVNSNLSELLREISIDRRRTVNQQTPEGYHQFMNLLSQTNVPLNAIGSERHRLQIATAIPVAPPNVYVESANSLNFPSDNNTFHGESVSNESRLHSLSNPMSSESRLYFPSDNNTFYGDDDDDNPEIPGPSQRNVVDINTPSTGTSSNRRRPTARTINLSSGKKKKQLKIAAEKYKNRRLGSSRNRRQPSPPTVIVSSADSSSESDTAAVYSRGIRLNETSSWKDYKNYK